MMIYRNIPLTKYNTFGLICNANCMIRFRTEKEAVELFDGTIPYKKPLLILGSGSNILFTDDFQGTILYPQVSGIKIEAQEPDKESVIVSSGAGVIWDDFVGWSVSKGFGGAENLSLIPGKVGATPVQNIGAYGVEIKELILKVRTISTENGSIRYFSNEECKFGYRNSVFKGELKGKYLVTRVYFRLATRPVLNLRYESLKEEIEKLGGATLKNVRQGVINIRRRKLPDPDIIGNAGSFFKNPVVISSFAINLKNKYPDMPVYNDREGYMKLASGWLIDKCGWKGIRKGNAGVHEKQALVLVNYGNASGKEIYYLSEEIKESVFNKFGVLLEREVEVVGTI
jgi:UDP-N-acetylmuramate dehydrogenase